LFPRGLDIEKRACAKHAPDVHFGSKADIGAHPINVRFTPKSGHWFRMLGCPLCAKSRHSALQYRTSCSIASSASIRI
jgi:hypothetical protein